MTVGFNGSDETDAGDAETPVAVPIEVTSVEPYVPKWQQPSQFGATSSTNYNNSSKSEERKEFRWCWGDNPCDTYFKRGCWAF